MIGKTSILKFQSKDKRQVFSKGIESIARKHWLETTILELAKHKGKGVEEDGESVPTRYQDKTDKESYFNFKEDCGGEVKN